MESGYFQPEVELTGDETIMSGAGLRNRDHIWKVLKGYLTPQTCKILEISSGGGMHVEYFATNALPDFPKLKWTPSEFDKRCFPSIRRRIKNESLRNFVEEPLFIDASDPGSWKVQDFDIIININMIHITPFACTEGLFRGAGQTLSSGGHLITYGPYGENGVISPDSNVSFNESLKSMNVSWGIRDISDLIEIANDNGLSLSSTHEMPANNKTLIWSKL